MMKKQKRANAGLLVEVRAMREHAGLAEAIGRRLSDSGLQVMQSGPGACEVTTLEVPKGRLPAALVPALSVLDLLGGERSVAADLPPGRVRLLLVGSGDALRTPVIVRCPERVIGAAIADALSAAGFEDVTAEVAQTTADRLRHVGCPELALNAASLVLAQFGAAPVAMQVARPPHGRGRDALLVDVYTPALTRVASTLVVETDEPAAVPGIDMAFSRLGFNVEVRLRDGLARVEVSPGALADLPGTEAIEAQVIAIAAELLPEHCSADYPVRRVTPERPEPVVRLPIRAIRNGLRPYGGDSHRRWPVHVFRDDKAAGQSLVAHLRACGFDDIVVRMLPDRVVQFTVRCGGGAQHSHRIRESIRHSLDAVMLETGEVDHPVDYEDGSDPVIEIFAPFRAAKDGTLRLDRDDPAKFSVEVRAMEPEASIARSYLSQNGFRNIEHSARPPDGDHVLFAGATRGFAMRVRDGLAGLLGSPRPELARMPEGGRRIIVSITPREVTNMKDDGDGRRSRPTHLASSGQDGTVPDDLAEGQPAFIDCGLAGFVRIGEEILPVASPEERRHVPGLPPGFTYDASTARVLVHLARCWKRKRSALLVGETGTTKSAAIRAFAHLTQRPLWSVSFSEQTEVDDLVGQISPTAEWWQFSPGAVIEAMRHGGVLLLDEINLSPPSILARLHDAHDRRFVLYEHGGEHIAAAEGFFLAATCNPTTYEGRHAMSPDLIERFSGFRTELAGYEAHLALLRRAVFGEQPNIRVCGKIYRGERVAPIFPGLGGLPRGAELLQRLARFHAEAECAAAKAEQDRSGWWCPVGPVVFSRRRLIHALEDIAVAVAAGDGAEQAAAQAVADRYLGFLNPDARDVIRDLAAASDLLGPGEA